MSDAREQVLPLPAGGTTLTGSGGCRSPRANLAHLLTHHVLGRLPGISRPYSRTLARRLRLRAWRAPVRGLPPSFDGYRILFLSDLHAGPFVDDAVLERTLARLVDERFDLILLGGDLITTCLDDYLGARDAFRTLRAPDGCHAVPGNHDHYSRRFDELVRLLREDGIGMLDNRSVVVKRDGAALTIAGIDDLDAAPDLDRALARREGPTVLVSHQPDALYAAAERNVDVMLAGHTHGGQIRLGPGPPLARQSRHGLHEGRFRCRNTRLLVSRGVGAVGLPIRLACDPEAWVVTLRAAGDL